MGVNAGAAQSDELPPGWVLQYHEGFPYYVDQQDQVSQWEFPGVCSSGNWARAVNPDGRAYWMRTNGESFFEDAATQTEWQRFCDREGRNYWSNRTLGIRFFEPTKMVNQL